MATYIGPGGIVSDGDPNFTNAGMPYNLKLSGSTTTDSNGQVYVGLPGWSWSVLSSYRRVIFTMATFWNDTEGQVATRIMLITSGNRAKYIADDAFDGSAGWGATVTFYGNQSTGQRRIYLNSASPNTVYNYEFRGITPNGLFDANGSF